MASIVYDIRTNKDGLTAELYKTDVVDILISGHTISNTIGVENIYSFSDEIFYNGNYKIKLIDLQSNILWHDNVDVSCIIDGWKFTINTNASGATNNTQFTLPTVIGSNYNSTINWGDGTTTPLTGATDIRKTHTYSSPGIHQIKISGLFGGFGFNNGGDCKKMITIDTYIPSNVNMSNITNGFYGCSNLTSIPVNLFKYCTSVTNFTNTFYDCTSLTSIPNNLFKYNTGVTTFAGTFGNCTNLTSIPNNIFDYNTKVTNFSEIFRNCTHITTIPVNLFKYNIDVINFSGTFRDCTSLTIIPNNIFDYNTKVTSFTSTFYNCTSIATIPVDLFRYNTGVTTFAGTLGRCTSIATIPVDLFRYNTGVTSFNSTFQYCTITIIPVDLFRYNTSVIDFSYIFRDTSITSISNNIFDYNTKVSNFNGTFYNCGSIATIPVDLFRYNTGVTSFNSTFAHCKNIILPPIIFNLSTLNIVTDFSYFMDITSTSDSNSGTIQDIWNYATSATHSSTFRNQTGLSDYATIPTSWK